MNIATTDSRLVNSTAKVLTQVDTFDKMVPLRINGDTLTIERHLRRNDPTSWKIIRTRMLQDNGFTEAVFKRIQQLEGVLFDTSELASLLIELPEGELLKDKLGKYIERRVTH